MTEPASIRFKNPGAMWGNALAKKWGSTETVTLHDGLGQGNNIAVFPTYVQGISAQLDLWRSSPNYKNKRFADAIAIWSGHNHVESYIAYVLARVPGMTRDTVMNDTFWHGPMGVEFLKAQAGHEAGKTYPAEAGDWIEAQNRVFEKQPPVVHVEPAPLPSAPVKKIAAGTATTSLSIWQLYVNDIENWVIGIVIALALFTLFYFVSKTKEGQVIMSKLESYFATAWDWVKRSFGRSKTIFINVFGIFAAVFVEMSDSITNLNLDDFFKHEVAAAIGVTVQLLNIILRVYTAGPVSFKRLDEVDVPVVSAVVPVPPVAPVTEVPQEPKAS